MTNEQKVKTVIHKVVTNDVGFKLDQLLDDDAFLADLCDSVSWDDAVDPADNDEIRVLIRSDLGSLIAHLRKAIE